MLARDGLERGHGWTHGRHRDFWVPLGEGAASFPTLMVLDADSSSQNTNTLFNSKARSNLPSPPLCLLPLFFKATKKLELPLPFSQGVSVDAYGLSQPVGCVPQAFSQLLVLAAFWPGPWLLHMDSWTWDVPGQRQGGDPWSSANMESKYWEWSTIT